jgi:hypothetical protein
MAESVDSDTIFLRGENPAVYGGSESDNADANPRR